jgi:hypothetical protein
MAKLRNVQRARLPSPPIEWLTLELSGEEAWALFRVLRKVGGKDYPAHKPRAATERILQALRDAGLEWSTERPYVRDDALTGGLVFED